MLNEPLASDAPNPTFGLTVAAAREDRGLSVSALAAASGVSRAMIAKIERDEAQPTAALLARLSGALGMTLSELIAQAENKSDRLLRRDRQPEWVDPTTGYIRRAVSPPANAMLQLVEIELPPHTSVPMPRESYLFIDQQIWMLDGRLRFIEGDEAHELTTGDCLQLAEPRDCIFENSSDSTCRYLVVLRKR